MILMIKFNLKSSKHALLAIILSICMTSPALALIFGFYSYSRVEGFVYDDSGNPLADVQVSYLDYQDFFRTFTDSTGHFELKLKMEGVGTRSKEQTEVCKKYINSAAPRVIPFPFLWSNKKNRELLSKNLYEREVSLSFRKLGMDILVIDTVVYCRTEDRDLKLNNIGIIHMKPSHNYDSFRNIDSKSYFTNKIIYKDIDYWVSYKDLRFYAGSDYGFDLFKHINKDYVNDNLMALGRRAGLYSTIAEYSTFAGLAICIGGAIVTKGSDRIYPITLGILTFGTGCGLGEKGRKMKIEFIYQHNRDIDKRFLIGFGS